MIRRVAPLVLVTAAVAACAAPSLQTSLATAPGATALTAKGALPTRQQPTEGPVVRVVNPGRTELTRWVEQGFDVWGKDGNMIVGEMPTKLYDELAKQGRRMDKASYKPLTPRSTFDQGYHTYETMAAQLKALAASNPAIAQIHDVGDGWEKTAGKANRDIWAIQITSKQASKTDKPSLLFLGNTHGRELAAAEVPFMFAKHLVENYGKDPQVTKWVDTRDIWVVPMVNPDGHARAEQGYSWRKNANPTNGGSGNSIGVDLNRNYSYQFGGAGASTNPSAETFRGPKALSEPESQAVARLYASRKWTFSVSYHSFSNDVLWPWSYGSDKCPDDKLLGAIATKMAKLSNYTAEQSSGMYPSSGDNDDMAYGIYKVLPFTVEIGTYQDGFDPPYSKVQQFFKENKASAEYLLSIADDPKQALK